MPSPRPSKPARRLPVLLGWVGRAVVGLVLGLVVAEGAVRVLNPTPRAQVVVPSAELVVEAVDGVPLWRSPGVPPELENAACRTAPGGLEVWVVGDSVLYTWFRDAGGRPVQLAVGLQRRLDASHPGSCVRNVSQPGYSGVQQLAELRRLLAARRPDLVYWGTFKGDGAYVELDGTWINVGAYETAADGLPRVRGLPLPTGIQRAWMSHSRFGRYATLALGAERPPLANPDRDVIPLEELHMASVAEAARAVAEAGGRLVLVLAPPLDRPFRSSVAQPPPTWRHLRAFAAAHGVGELDLARALVDEDVERLRFDLCCHYGEAGQEALAGVFHASVRAERPAP